MNPYFKQLTLPELILDRRGPLLFRLLLAVFGIALRLFFRRIETVNADSVPTGTGVIFVMNHPNGLIDPALVFVALPRRISFLAKSTLFKMPVISFILQTVEALPVYRKLDAGEDVSRNQETFKAAEDHLRKGGSIALFPEGVSHNSPKLLPIKTGAARIALGAASVGHEDTQFYLKIVPVGLFYTSKTTFRSEVLLYFGRPFSVDPIEPEVDGQPPREAVRRLTSKIEESLREVTLNAETEADLHAAMMAEEIIAAAAVNENLGEKLEFLKKFVGDGTETNSGVSDKGLREKIIEYDRKLDEFGIEPEHLSLAQFSRWSVIRQAFLQTWPLVAVAPLALTGALVHYPAYRLSGFVAGRMSRHGADDVASTVKVLAGMVFIPLTWLIAAAAVFYFLGWRSALLSIPIWIVCGYVAMRTQEEVAELSGWARATWLYFARREAFLRMFVERRELQHRLRGFDER
ncbi:MAG TPA: lysophospholipid acyltransferase family protein [Pyrinomonadaceae bacterium]|nr:lysophospholipid acyltransferase family protein [Pyrinomonadaceae bacterium]